MRLLLHAAITASLLFLGNLATSAAAARVFKHGGASYAIDLWESDDGLAQNSVIAMAQTRDGYLWMGTLNGLVRFDGVRFTVFDESKTPGLPSSQIVCLYEDRQARLWIGTEAAGTVLVSEGQVRVLPWDGASRGGRLRAVGEDPRGGLWLYTADGQLARYWQDKLEVTKVDAGRPSSCRSLVVDQGGALWVANDARVFSMAVSNVVGESGFRLEPVETPGKVDGLLAARDGGHWLLAGGRVLRWRDGKIVRDFGAYPWGTATVSATCEDADGSLVVGTLGAGLYWFNDKGQATRLGTGEGLSNDYILSLLLDRENSLWVGTDGGGVNRLRRLLFEVAESTRDRVVQSVSVDRSGAVLIGYSAGGVEVWKDGKTERAATGAPGREAPVRAVLVDRQGRWWVGTLGQGLLQWQSGQLVRAAGTESVHPGVMALYEDRAERLWVGTEGGLGRLDGQSWRTFGPNQGLPIDGVRAVTADGEGEIWVATSGHGLFRSQGGRFSAISTLGESAGKSFSSLFADTDGAVWVGTQGHGLLRYKGGKWLHLTTREGLLSNSVGGIEADEQGYLWVGSNAGLLRAARSAFDDLAQGKITLLPGRAYGRPDGMPTRECSIGSQPGVWRGEDGRLWFPTVRGLTLVQPAALRPNLQPPLINIEAVLLDGQPLVVDKLRARWPAVIVVPAGRERVEIHYTSLNLTAPDRARFRYRLEGYEKDWTEAGTTRVARFSRLPPSEYRFHVKACNEDGLWNETGLSLSIIVQPPFWRTWWFLCLTTGLLLAMVVRTVHVVSTRRLQRQLAESEKAQMIERERSRIARDIHDQVGANLTQVLLMVDLVETDKDFPDDVEAHARRIAKTARETTKVLDEIVWAVNPANDTLDGLVTYFCKYAQEYLTVAGVRYRMEAPAQLPSIPLPPDVRHNIFLAAKEAVTNVVKHAQATEAKIRVRTEASRFVFEIEDNGKGLGGLDPEAARLRNGLKNMRKRMEDVGGSFEMLPAAGAGAVVRLTGPLGGWDKTKTH